MTWKLDLYLDRDSRYRSRIWNWTHNLVSATVFFAIRERWIQIWANWNGNGCWKLFGTRYRYRFVPNIPYRYLPSVLRIRIQSDPYIIGSPGSGSGSSNLKTDHELKFFKHFLNFFQICLKFYPFFSSLLKEFLQNQKIWNKQVSFFKKFEKILLCHQKAWIRIRILKKRAGSGSGPYIKYTDPQHCLPFLLNVPILLCTDAMDTEEGAKQKNLAMAKKKFNMDPKKVLPVPVCFKPVFRIRIHVDSYWNGSPGSGSGTAIRVRIRIRIQDSQNCVQKGKKNLRFQV